MILGISPGAFPLQAVNPLDIQIRIGKIKYHGKQSVFACVLLHLVFGNADLCHSHHIVFVKYFPFQFSQEIFDPILQQYIMAAMPSVPSVGSG